MLPLPPDMTLAYNAILKQRKIASGECNDYRKWLRYYLDYCHKYHVSPTDKLSFSAFHEKLSSKNQSEASCRQAHAAVVLYHEMLRSNHDDARSNAAPSGYHATESSSTPAPPQTRGRPSGKKFSIDRARAVSVPPDLAAKSDLGDLKLMGASWVAVYDRLNSAIKVRHYSPKTLQAYRSWIRQFQAFTLSKDPELLCMDDVKGFLSSLAVEKKVALNPESGV